MFNELVMKPQILEHALESLVAKNEQKYHKIRTWTVDHGVGIGDIGSEIGNIGSEIKDIGSESSGISLVVNTKNW